MKRKGKIRMLIIIPVILVTTAALVLGGGVLFTAGERREAKNLPIDNINFKQLNDGVYVGEYEYEGRSGLWKANNNKVQVTVSAGKVNDIKLLEQKGKQVPQYTDKLYDSVIKAQSLQVDTISGATITSKAYLKSVEDALEKAQKK
jgi:uncharacterized protein with FMN-binding domain